MTEKQCENCKFYDEDRDNQPCCSCVNKENFEAYNNVGDKMQSKDIIKVLECCVDAEVCDTKCPLYDEDCNGKVERLALDLIKNQQAEIEKLKGVLESMGVDTKKQIDMFESYEKQIEELKFQVDARDSHILKLKQENDDLRERNEWYKFFYNSDVDTSDLLM